MGIRNFHLRWSQVRKWWKIGLSQTLIYSTGAVLQIGRSLVRSHLVSLEFFIDIILLIALWPWGGLSL